MAIAVITSMLSVLGADTRTVQAEAPPGAGEASAARGGDAGGGHPAGARAVAPAGAKEPEARAVAPPPPGFAVALFDNRTGIAGLYWLGAAAPFVLAERAEHALALRLVSARDPWVLPRDLAPPADAAAVAAQAAASGAAWMWTGWLAGNRGALELGVQLWRTGGSEATLMSTVVRRGPQEQVFRMLGEAIGALAAEADLEVRADRGRAMDAAPTEDFYAFTLFGRGLAELAGLGPGGWMPRRPERVRLRRAQGQLARAVHIDPRFAPAQRVLGEVHRALGQHDQARARIEAALRLDPGYLPALATRAALAQRDGEVRRAETMYRDYLAQRPWDHLRRYELGRMLWQHGRMDEAHEELARVVAQDAEHLQARRILVRIYARRGELNALIRALEALYQRDAVDVADRFELAAAYMAAGRAADAVRIYESVAGSPTLAAATRAQARKLLGDLHRRRGETGEAMRAYRLALEAAPDDPRPYFLLGALHLEAGDQAAAADVFRRAQRFRRLAAPVHNNLGAIAYHQGKLGEARWYLRRAVWMRPRSVRYRYNLALALAASGELTAALAEIRVGLGIAPEHAELHYLRGVVALRQGKLDEARTSFENTLRLAPGHPDARHNLMRLERMRRGGPADPASDGPAAP